MITEPEEIENEFVNKLTKIYSPQPQNNQNSTTFSSNLDFSAVQDRHHLLLTKIPDEEEIKSALFELHPYKTPGEDGLHAIFYQEIRDIVKKKIVQIIQNSFRTNCITDSWGDTLLFLITKTTTQA